MHLSLDGATFTPRVAAINSGGRVTFVNDQASPIVVRSDTLSPRRFSLAIVAHGRAALRLAQPGLYHYYDAGTARPWRALASSTSTPGS